MFYIRARKLWTKNPHVGFDHTDWRRRSVDVFVHHTADSGPVGGARATIEQEKAYLQRIEAFHMKPPRGYRAIGYSYLVMRSGRVYEGRGFEAVGAHTLDPKDADRDKVFVENTEIGICFPMNGEKQKLTRRQILAFKALKVRLRLYGCRLDKQYPHHAAFATSCPGKYVVEQLGLKTEGTKA